MTGMLHTRGTSKGIAYASVFAVVYSITRLFPVSVYVGINNNLTFGETFSPLAGMLFGPYVGALSVTLGTFLDFLLGRPVVFDGLDFVPGAVAAATAGLCFTGRIRESLALPLLFMALFTVDPISSSLISVGPAEVPFLWMHLLSVMWMVVVWALLARRGKDQFRWLFIASTVFLSTMSAHVAGSVLYENVLGRINAVFPPSAFPSLWEMIFFRYPVERAFFTVAGTLIAIPVLRALSRRTNKLEEPRDGAGHLASPRLPADVVGDILPSCDYLQGRLKDRFRRSLLAQVVEHPGRRENRGRGIDLVEPLV